MEAPIDPEKRGHLQSLACVLVDKLSKAGTIANRRLEAFLGLMGLRSLVITVGYTHFNEELHNIVGHESVPSLEPGTIAKVVRRGFRDIHDGKVVRRAYVITSE